MKICLASIHPRLLSGQIEGLVALGDELEALGHDVHLVSAFRAEDLHAGQRWQLNTNDGGRLGPKLARIGGIIQALVREARGCDLVHFNLPTPAFAGLADLVQLLTRRPMVVGFEAHLVQMRPTLARLAAAPEFYGPRVVINNGLVARMTLRRAARVVVASEHQRRELVALGYPSARVDVIPNLIDVKKLSRRPRAEARQALGLPDGPLVAFAGHYHDVKGHDTLVRAFAHVLQAQPSARLALAWSGIGNRGRLRQEIARAGIGPAVIELGRLPVADLFAAADVVALPYRLTIGQAAYPGTVLEAMWVGAPLVTSRLPLLAELVEHEHTGLLARPGDAADLGAQIIRLLTDPALAERMVAAQRQLVQTRFQPDQLARAYVATYEQASAGEARVLQAA